jgi:hypothetical protein
MQSKGFNVRVRGADDKNEDDEADADDDEGDVKEFDDDVDEDDEEDGNVRSKGTDDGGAFWVARDKSASPTVAGSAGMSEVGERAAA